MEPLFQLQHAGCTRLSVTVADHGIEIFSCILLIWIIFTAAMDSSMTASMVAFATSIDNIPLPEFVSLDPQYMCVYCHRILNMPRQLPCGHRICKLCVDKLLQYAVGRSGIRCPSGDVECNSDITAEQVIQCHVSDLIYCKLIAVNSALLLYQINTFKGNAPPEKVIMPKNVTCESMHGLHTDVYGTCQVATFVKEVHI